MDIILLQRVEKLGNMGDVVHVRAGYARNYLLPQGKALRATDENRETFERQRAELETANAGRKVNAEAVSGDLDGKVCVLIRQASDSGQLYGSVSAHDIAEAAAAAAGGIAIDRDLVQLDRPIKTLGIHAVRIFLHPEVPATVQVVVARTEAEAELQLQDLGKADSAEDAAAADAGKVADAASKDPVIAAEEFFEEGAGPRAEDADDAEGADEEAEQEADEPAGETPESKGPPEDTSSAKPA